MKPAIRVRGVAELRRALALVDAQFPKELAKANQEVGLIVAEEAIRRAPKGRHQGGGHIVPIAASIKSLARQNKVTVEAGGPRTPHAAVYEFGGTIPRRGGGGLSRRLRRQSGRAVTRIAKHSYLYAAVDAKREQVINAYFQMIDRLISRFERG